MAELNTAKELDDIYGMEYWTDAITGGQDKRMYLYYQLINSLKQADSVDIVVSFLMESGVRMLLSELENALKRGAKIRILTGNYLGITQPSALYLIKHKLGEQVDLRFYNEKNRSFHPKSYMFHYKEYSTIYIGSSNISRSALTSGIEWNYRFSSKTDPQNYEKFYNTFLDLFENHSVVIDDDELKRYSKNWHRPAVSKDLDKYDLQDSETSNNMVLFEPRGAQIEALCALENTRAEGARRALVQAATGVGKTYLAAFDSKKYERVLFVAHREEILKQAAESFKNVRNSDDYGFFDGESKCTDKSVIFASVATLGRNEYLNNKYFPLDYFNYVVIDEFHHAINDQYQRIVNYFKPQFLTVLDFIGNYEKAGRVRFLLEGKSDTHGEVYHPSDTLRFPDDCLVDFDMKLIDLFAEMDRKHLKLKDQIINEYFKVKELLAKRPTRLDMFTYMDDNIYEAAITHSKDNPFKRYLEFLNDLGELSQIEEEFYKGIGREFISLLENTNMSKVYKMPVHFLLESGKGFFIKNDDVILGLREELRPLIDNPVMIQQMKDVIDYRTMDYYQRRYRETQN